MKHVLIVNHVSNIGGAELSMKLLIQNMDRQKYRYTVALPSHGPFFNLLIDCGIDVDIVKINGWRFWVRSLEHKFKFILTMPLSFFSTIKWIKYLYLTKPDIVHFNINRLVEPIIAAKILNIPTLMHFRDIPSRMDSNFIFGMNSFYRLMCLSNVWVSNSDATYNDIKNKAVNRVFNIPNGVDLSLFDRKNPSKNYLHNKKIIVAMIAAIVPWKNYSTFLKVASKVNKSKKDVEFWIIGSGDKGHQQELESLALNLNINQHIKFTGFVDNIYSLINDIDILVHTTIQEPFGRVFIEAMAARKPIVAFNSGGAAQIILNNETGVLVPPGDAQRMSDAILTLINEPNKRRKMGENGRIRVESLFSIDRHCKEISNVYDYLTHHL